jgi:catechol 2,3-dioxygenase-like lactoylglutathione lyase family enzyme
MDMRLEVVVLPVSDVDRAKKFYQGLGWRLDGDYPFNESFRVVQLTPPGSASSIIFGKGITTAKPGTADGLHLVVDNIDAARAELAGRGANVSEVFHDAIAPFHHAGTAERVSGPVPNRQSYGSWLSFADPDGNTWFVQEITIRLPGRTTSALAVYGSVESLAAALRRAASAHGKHEQSLGHRDENWPDWYAQYMVDESTRQDKAA